MSLIFDFNLEKIDLGNIYLPITALLEGEAFIVGFSTTLLMVKLFLSIFFYHLHDLANLADFLKFKKIFKK